MQKAVPSLKELAGLSVLKKLTGLSSITKYTDSDSKIESANLPQDLKNYLKDIEMDKNAKILTKYFFKHFKQDKKP